jgi:hypothetical protein
MHEELTRLAAEEHRSVNAQVVYLIEQHLKEAA